MATSWKAQQDLKTGKYYLQFETDDKEKYKQVEKLCQQLMNNNISKGIKIVDIQEPFEMPYLPDISMIPEPCRGCSNHPNNGGSGYCNCTLGSMQFT